MSSSVGPETSLHVLYFLFFVLQGGGGGLSALYSMRDLSSLTRDRTRAPCSGSAES